MTSSHEPNHGAPLSSNEALNSRVSPPPLGRPKPVKILDPILANQIAAGEVVERPASAIKELIENALDAGATALTIEIREGGRALMRVADNGHGMTREDALLALERHATSKISAVDDLNAISTLGFRGEALPSIASVSRFQLTTRVEGESAATQVRVEGGQDRKVVNAAGRVGTEILIKDLFFNVPARRKFLKSAQTESGIIHESVQRVALAYPEVSFRFIKDGHASLDLPIHHDTAERVRALFGARLADHLCPVSWTGPVRLRGLVSHPSFHFSAHRHAYVFINGRFVKDRIFLGAIQRAFGQRLPKGRYPFYLIHLDIHPSLVDVNVHPAKTQVRFVNEEALLDVLTKAFKAAMREMNFEEESSWRDQVVKKGQSPAQPVSSSQPTGKWSEHQRSAHSSLIPQETSSDLPTSEISSATESELATRDALEAHRQQIQARINRRLLGEGNEGALELPPLEISPPQSPRAEDSRLSTASAERSTESTTKSAKRQKRAEVIDSGRHDQQHVTQADLDAWRRGPQQRLASDHSISGQSTPDQPRSESEGATPPISLSEVSLPSVSLGASAPSTAQALPPLSALPSPEAWSALRIVGRADDWWIQQADDGLLLTHLPTARAHAVTDQPIATPLERPAQLNLSPRELSGLETHQDSLTALGVELSLFGGSTSRLIALPRGLEDEPLEALLEAITSVLSAPPETTKMSWISALIQLPLSTSGRTYTLDWLSGGGTADPQGPPYSLPLSYAELSRRSQHLNPF